MEKVDLGNVRSWAKIMGTVFCVSGAVVMATVKGPKLLGMELLPNKLFFGEQDTWFIGCLFLLASACSWSLWLILQVLIFEFCFHNSHLTFVFEK